MSLIDIDHNLNNCVPCDLGHQSHLASCLFVHFLMYKEKSDECLQNH